MGRVSGKVALISGGARGMGAAHARLLVSEGAQVVIGDLIDDLGKEVADELGDAATYVHLDVTSYSDWEAAVATAVRTYGHLDVLVNNAGIGLLGPVTDAPLADWDRVIAINLTGTFYGIRAAAPALRASSNASIINVSSIAGLQGYPGMAAYTASKYGVRGLTKAAALDLGPDAIRVNSVHPGLIRTPMTQGADESQNHVALHRAADPIEVSRLVLFLASDESSFSTGAEFVADGGETAGLAGFSPV